MHGRRRLFSPQPRLGLLSAMRARWALASEEQVAAAVAALAALAAGAAGAEAPARPGL